MKDLGKLQEAEISTRKAIELNPDLADAYNNLGNILIDLRRYNEATISYKKAYKIDPKNAWYHIKAGLEISDFHRYPLITNKILMESINNCDWEKSKILLEENCNNSPEFTTDNVNEFIKLWCDFSMELVNQNSLHKLLPIFSHLLIIKERNNDLNKLIKYVFDSYDLHKVLETAVSKDKILLTLGFCEYKFLKREFSEIEDLASNNIQASMILLKDNATEDLGWLVIRRSLVLFNQKDLARSNLMNLINNL